MPLGDRQHQVTLDTTDGFGGVTPLDPATWWADARSEGGTQVAFTGAYHPGITTVTRVHFKGRIYHVTSVDNHDERDLDLTIHCTEVFD